MLAARRPADFGMWSAPGHSPAVVYSQATVRRIATEMGEALNRGSNGADWGGVLLGTFDGDEIRITAYRPAVLTGQGIREVLEACAEDPGLAGLVPAGWYRAVGDREMSLSEEDVELWNQWFPHSTQVALVLRAVTGQPTRGGFYIRAPHTPVRTQTPSFTFEAGPPSGAALAETEWSPVEPPRFASAEAGRSPWTRAAILLAPAALAGAALWWWNQPVVAAPAPPAVGLRVTERNAQLIVHWNPQSAPVREASGAELKIIEGEQARTIDLAPERLAEGTWRTSRSSTDVMIHLRIVPRRKTDAPVFEVARFAGNLPDHGAGVTDADVTLLRQGVHELRSRLRRIGGENVGLEARAEFLRKQHTVPARPYTPPVPPRGPRTVSPEPMARPPVIESRPEAPPAEEPLVMNTGPRFADRILPRAASSPGQPATVAQGARSGRLIWTGRLEANSILTIAGNSPSSGALNGALPGVPVRVAAYPAELMGNRLAVYSSRESAQRAEPPGSATGWLDLRYTYDPVRAANLTLATLPGVSNDHSRLQLRAAARAVSAIVIDWETAP